MAFKSLSKPRTRLADQVYDQITKAIRDGSISPKDRIVQEKLAEQFDISRTPIREALFRMEQEGILTVSEHGGFEIRKLDRKEIAELYDSRAAIEGYAARILSERKDKKSCDRLRKIILKEEDLKEPTVQAYFMANMNIHRAFVKETRNRFLLELFDNIWGRGSSFTSFASIRVENLSKSLGDHMALVDAIEAGNGVAATEKMVSHIFAGQKLQLQT
jgi:DNA-binding GntR family transcriptional regulator